MLLNKQEKKKETKKEQIRNMIRSSIVQQTKKQNIVKDLLKPIEEAKKPSISNQSENFTFRDGSGSMKQSIVDLKINWC